MALLSFIRGLFSKKNQKQEVKTPEIPISQFQNQLLLIRKEAIEKEIKSEEKKIKKKEQPKAVKPASTKQVKAKKQPAKSTKK